MVTIEDFIPRVALIFGGRGCERKVSLLGANNLFGLIDRQTYDVILIYIDEAGRFLAYNGDEANLSDIVNEKMNLYEVHPAFCYGKSGFLSLDGFTPIDAAFPLLHGDFGEDGRVQGALECARIPFVGCNTMSGAIARDKSIVKAVARSLKIPVVNGITVCPKDKDDAISSAERLFDYPMFVKPTRLGSSIGAGVANDRRELIERLSLAFTLDECALIEEYIDIERELECAYFAAGDKEIFTSPGEIRAKIFYDFEKKYENTSNSVSVRDHTDVALDGEIRNYAEQLIRALSVRDISRIDFFLSKSGRLYFNEINTMPGFTSTSLYLRLLNRTGIPPKEAVNLLIDNALRRGA